MIDEPTPLSVEQRVAMAREAMDEVGIAVRKYLEATVDDGDIESLSNCVVVYEDDGLEPDGTRFYRSNYFIAEHSGTMNSALGMMVAVMRKVEHDVVGCGG